MRLLPLLLLLAASSSIAQDSDAVARGDAAWARRAEGFTAGGRPDPAPGLEASRAYEEAHAADPGSVGIRLKLIEALWFEGHFVETDREASRRIFDRMTRLAEDTVALVEATAGSARTLRRLEPAARAEAIRAHPHAADAHFWAAISWGLWAMSHGNAASGFKGVASRIRAHAEILVALDEEHAGGGGLRLLGRLHAATPKVPMFTGWVDGSRGIELLRRAHAIAPEEPRNGLYLAEALLKHDPSRRDEALGLLHELATRRTDPAFLVEQQEILDEARRVLAETESP